MTAAERPVDNSIEVIPSTERTMTITTTDLAPGDELTRHSIPAVKAEGGVVT